MYWKVGNDLSINSNTKSIPKRIIEITDSQFTDQQKQLQKWKIVENNYSIYVKY